MKHFHLTIQIALVCDTEEQAKTIEVKHIQKLRSQRRLGTLRVDLRGMRGEADARARIQGGELMRKAIDDDKARAFLDVDWLREAYLDI